MDEQQQDELQAAVARIRDLHAPTDELAQQIRAVAASLENGGPLVLIQDGMYWRFAAFGDGLVRLRLLLEQNFHYIEQMGLLAACRYIFELTVWLRLMHNDPRYGVAYHAELINAQFHYWEDLRDHLRREVTLFNEIADDEDRLVTKQAQEIKASVGTEEEAAAIERFHQIAPRIDAMAARKFSLFGEQAKRNGYRYQAHLIQKRDLPRVEESLAAVGEARDKFKQALSVELSTFLPRKWIWKEQATAAGMLDEYEFIYSYSSRLLHATPASLTTDKKNLEPWEMLMFLRYFAIKATDVLQMGASILASGSPRH